MIEKINNKNKVLKILGGVIILLLLVLIICRVYLNTKKVSELEKIKLEEVSDNVTRYLEYVKNDKDLDGYIIYILKNSENESMTLNELIEKLNSIFDKKVTDEEIVNLGITPNMMDEKITYDYATSTFSIDKSTDIRDIADTQIVSYEITKITKDDDKYIVTYDKLLVKNPYEILNYYNDNNKIKESDEIQKYLQNKGTIDNILKYINSKNSKKSGEVTITYIVKDNKILIEKIEEK